MKLAALLVANYPQMPKCVKLAALLVANYPQMPLCVKMAALLVANYPQMLPCMNLGTLLVVYYCMLSANYTITDMDKTSVLLQLHQYLLNIATKPLNHL